MRCLGWGLPSAYKKFVPKLEFEGLTGARRLKSDHVFTYRDKVWALLADSSSGDCLLCFELGRLATIVCIRMINCRNV